MANLFASIDSTVKALSAHSRAIETTGKNLANVNNPAYARQRIIYGDRGTIMTPQGAESLGLEALGIEQLRDTLLDLMWDDVGIIRDKPGMQRALSRLDELGGDLADAGVPDGNRAFILSWHDWLNLKSQIEMSKVVTHAALARENSRGSHFREDFKEPGDLTTSRFTVVREVGGQLDVTDEPVQFTHVKPGETLLDEAPKAAE